VAFFGAKENHKIDMLDKKSKKRLDSPKAAAVKTQPS
jgi:hypothetical protein